ncbi:G1/S-specific cyclin-E [Caenorhabditis elegans]|uniref:Isoform b of G1/S-specific cyclin-E n=1 Tax=Caenorhabditis elegans TaxID=6239 RepID=O01501-2|nr:G1/S-specific cyclin-E [Caenorhabditis elegans]CCD66922.1 G1/S-specific cyclin-E [Caenorhabditis elegans]|eukprot:NP_001021028.1 G1/S-specific cyclin-E [Caenorhabditis elegans]
MAGRKSSRTAERVPTTQKPERKSAILSPHDELRERLLETAIDMKENIPQRNTRNSSVGSQKSDCSETRKRRSTKEGPAAKRHSGEKHRNGSREDSLEYISDDREVGSSSSQSSRTRGQPLPAMPEEEEVFDKSSSSDNLAESEESHEMVRLEERQDIEEEIEDDFDDEEEDVVNDKEEYEEIESEDEDDYPVQNEGFAVTKRLMNDEHMVTAPTFLSTAKCDGIGSPTKVWSLMVKRDEIPRATRFLLGNHPDMDDEKRRILIDWMMEVCESEKLHRETFHLAVDYVDRYLESSNVECSTDNFQLVGTAALFIAAKYEEIYPPKCIDFAHLTDSAFTCDNIRTMEVLIVKYIGWSLGPITSIQWLSTYLQLLGTGKKNKSDHYEEQNMYVPELLRSEYLEMCKILDFLLFEIDSFTFSYRTIAAAVLFVNYEPTCAVEKATGFMQAQLEKVIEYVEPVCRAFAKQRQLLDDVIPKHESIKSDDSHNIQVYVKRSSMEPIVKSERERIQHLKARRLHPQRLF